MRLAIIADIHGNFHALKAVLDDIEQQQVDEIIVNGDLVNRGPDNIRVMETISALECHLILGNHDDLMVKWVARDPSLPADWFGDPFWDAMAWSAKQLEEANWLDHLRQLPMTRWIKPEGAPSIPYFAR